MILLWCISDLYIVYCPSFPLHKDWYLHTQCTHKHSGCSYVYVFTLILSYQLMEFAVIKRKFAFLVVNCSHSQSILAFICPLDQLSMVKRMSHEQPEVM